MTAAHITINLDDAAEMPGGKNHVRVTVRPADASWARFHGDSAAGPFLDLGTRAVAVTIAPGPEIAASDVAAARALLIAVADYTAEIERLHLAQEGEAGWTATELAPGVAA